MNDARFERSPSHCFAGKMILHGEPKKMLMEMFQLDFMIVRRWHLIIQLMQTKLARRMKFAAANHSGPHKKGLNIVSSLNSVSSVGNLRDVLR